MSRANIIIEAYCLLITVSLQICNYMANRHIVKTKLHHILCTMLFVNGIIITAIIITVLIDGNENMSWLNSLSEGICYIGGAVLTLLFGEYVIALTENKKKPNLAFVIFLRTACCSAAVLDFISIFNGMYFGTLNGYHIRGPFYLINQSWILCVMLAEFIFILSKRKIIGSSASALTLYGLIPAAASVLQIFTNEYVLLYPAITLSMFILYVVSYISQARELNQKNIQLEKAIEETEKAKRAAEKANRAKSDFLSSMSHDIRTPLNAIIGMTDMAVDNIDNKKQALDNLNVVQSSSKHLLSLVNDVLDLSMIESGKIAIAKTEFILPDLLIEVEKIAWPLTVAKNQEFILDADKVDDEFYIGDEPRLKQILVNFLSNAVKYTPSEGKIILCIEEEKAEDQKHAVIKMSCIDNGIGIDKDVQEIIFEPFVREVKSTVNPIEGTGLGLTIVSNIVKAMHGTISVVSEKGIGSTFTACIPLEIADEEKMLQQFDDVKDYFVLLNADDEETCNFIRETYPQVIGVPCDVKMTADILNHTAVYSSRYDAIISISETDAVKVIRQLREKFPNTDIICGCRMNMLEKEDQILNAGADAVLYRPAFRSTMFEEFQELKRKKSRRADSEKYLEGKNILVVEDQAINYLIVEHMLKNAGAYVWQAENGQEAVDIFMGSQTGRFDLIMMDIMMPVMDGYTATQKIRKADRPDAKTIPIVAMTANAFAEDVQKSKSYGMNAHISKPMEPETVKEVLIRLLDTNEKN